MEIDGLITRKVIRKWLENYDRLVNDDKILNMGMNTGSPPDDGISNAMLNKIMLDAALEKMKRVAPNLYTVAKCRWLEQRTWKEAKQITGLAKSTYYYRANVMVVNFIYFEVNGKAAGLKKLIEEIANS